MSYYISLYYPNCKYARARVSYVCAYVRVYKSICVCAYVFMCEYVCACVCVRTNKYIFICNTTDAYVNCSAQMRKVKTCILIKHTIVDN